jgi:Raf kinase inhibitor-like YbhB/YbcL family protein
MTEVPRRIGFTIPGFKHLKGTNEKQTRSISAKKYPWSSRKDHRLQVRLIAAPLIEGILLVQPDAMAVLLFLLSLALQPRGLTVTSPDFPNGGDIPVRFTCDGQDINPTLLIDGIPSGTRSLVLIVEDPDAELTRFTQWLVWNIPPTHRIAENTIPGIQGTNTVGKNPYRGPCPAAGPQRYAFKVYALDRFLELEETAMRYNVEEAMNRHVLAVGELVGSYDRAAIAREDK